jgi:hypothetical protein
LRTNIFCIQNIVRIGAPYTQGRLRMYLHRPFSSSLIIGRVVTADESSMPYLDVEFEIMHCGLEMFEIRCWIQPKLTIVVAPCFVLPANRSLGWLSFYITWITSPSYRMSCIGFMMLITYMKKYSILTGLEFKCFFPNTIATKGNTIETIIWTKSKILTP